MKIITKNKCQNESFALSKAYKEVCDSDFQDEIYQKYSDRKGKSFLSSDAMKKIEQVVMTDPNFRPIDIHQFDINSDKAVWA
jgi:hypothetical protein